MAIDVTLRDQRSQPGSKPAAAVEIAEQRLPDAVTLLQAEQLCVELLRDLSRGAGGIDRIRGAIHAGAEFEDEVIPRVVAPDRTGARQSNVSQVERIEIAIELGV